MRRLLLPLIALLAAGCGRANDVVLYCALDESFAAPVVREFERRTGLHVDAYYDVEADKSVGLRRRLQQEAQRPVCDVFWNNEPVQSVVLAEGGLLAPYRSPARMTATAAAWAVPGRRAALSRAYSSMWAICRSSLSDMRTARRVARLPNTTMKARRKPFTMMRPV